MVPLTFVPAMLPPQTHVYQKHSYFSSRLPPDPSRDRLWRVLCEYLQRDIPDNARILELGGGYCNFINNIAGSEKHVVDLYPEITEFAAPGVIAHVQSCVDLDLFPSGHFDTVFASNLFEHLTRQELEATVTGISRILNQRGSLLIVQPNFKYTYRDYFDDYTHVQIFTHVSLMDFLAANGFRAQRVIARFLPFSLKTSGPKWPWLLRLYLSLPWRPFAGQMYIAATKSRSADPV